MILSRRQFIVGAGAVGAGLILPEFAKRALSHFEKTGQPLLEHSNQSSIIYHALSDGDSMILIDTSVPFSFDPPPTTWRQFFKYEGLSYEEAYEIGWDIESKDLDEEAYSWAVESQWGLRAGPTARPVVLLEGYGVELAPSPDGELAELGCIDIVEGQYPGSNDRWVEVSDFVGLSCLQHRLTALNSEIKIELAPEGLY